MTDYSKLSDDEINGLVSDAMGIPRGDKWCKELEMTGPIMLSNRIGIEPSLKTEKWVAQTNNFRFAYGHDNPLRAALIVFLMMKDAENEQRD